MFKMASKVILLVYLVVVSTLSNAESLVNDTAKHAKITNYINHTNNDNTDILIHESYKSMPETSAPTRVFPALMMCLIAFFYYSARKRKWVI